MGTGQKLWKHAKELIPGGNMLLSKRAEMFLPEHWPAYFSKAKGCQVWDLDNNQYTDMSIMGIGTNILGYGHEEVDEAVRNMGPEDNFLHKVRQLATERGIVLIFDECTSGFRETYGGIYQKYGVEPDIAIYSKTLGNGYAIAAIVGRTEVMQAAQTTFISSTFWTERIGPTAALKTLEVMERTQSWQTITQTGLNIRQQWQTLADKYELNINHWGIPALTGFTFQSENALQYKTLITQEMLKQGYLAATSVYVCTEHTPEIIAGYFEQLDPIFKLIKECEEGRDINALLEGPVCHAGFKRLN